jgi:predicted RNA-binding protein with PUA-like domain
MNYWLIKSEPGEYSFQDLMNDKWTRWDGVRNYAARNHLRAMKTDDLALFYHSVDDKEVVGICKVVQEFYPDPTAESGDWSAVDFAPVKLLEKKVNLIDIKAEPALQNIGLVRIGRLSVMPLEEVEFFKILDMGGTKI